MIRFKVGVDAKMTLYWVRLYCSCMQDAVSLEMPKELHSMHNSSISVVPWAFGKGKQIHVEIVRQGLLLNNIVLGNADLVGMYA
eukprot:c25763_g1_i1 orf=50-301(-)